MAINGGEIISYLTLDTSAYGRSLEGAAAMAQGFGEKMGALSRVGSLALTTAVVGITGYAGKAATEFESAFAGVRKTVDTTRQGYAVLRDEIMKIGRIVPKTHAELAGIMEIGGQLGVSERNLKGFTKTIADLDVATNLRGQEGASMLAQYANISGMAFDNIDRLGSVIVHLGNNTATTELDITQMAQRLAGTAAIIKMTEAETFALSATMSSLGINAEAGGSAMSRVLQKMDKARKAGGDSLNSFAKVAGMTEKEFKNLFGESAISALEAYVKGLSAINEAGGNVYAALEEVDLNDLRVSDTLLRMSAAQGALARNVELANTAWKENMALTKEAEQRYSTTESKLALAKNKINEEMIRIGDGLLPHIASLAEFVSGAVEGFGKLSDGTQKFVLGSIGLLAAAKPVLGVLRGIAFVLGSGAGGIAAGAALAGIAIARMINEGDLSALQQAKALFGDITLSVEDVQTVIKAGFPKPVIDITSVQAAANAAIEAKNNLANLEEELKKKVYLIRLGLTGAADLEESAKQYVEASQTSLMQEGVFIKANISAHFGEGSAKGTEIISIVDGWIEGQRDRLKAAGDKLTKIILDNTFANEEVKAEAIQKGIQEIAEIRAQMQLADTEATREALLYKWKGRGLDFESYKSLTNEVNEYVNDERNNAETVWTNTLKSLAFGKNKMPAEEYRQMVDETNMQYGKNLAEIELTGASLLFDTVGKDRVEQARRYIEELKKLRDELAENPDKRLELHNNNMASEIVEAREVASDSWKYMEPTYEGLKKMKEELGALNPKFEKMLAELELLKSFSEISSVDEKSLIEQMERLRSDEESRKNAGKEDAAAYVTGQTEEMSASQDSLKSAYMPPDVSSEFGGAGENAANAFIHHVRRKVDEANRASASLGKAALHGLNSALEIRSPSRASQRAAGHFTSGFIKRVDADGDVADITGRNFAKKVYNGLTQEAAVQKGKLDRMNNFTMHYTAGIRHAGGGLPKLRQEDRDYYRRSEEKRKRGGSRSAASNVEDYGIWMPFALPDRTNIDILDTTREKLLALSGAHRAYYDETEQDKALKSAEEKWAKLIDAEIKGYEALSDAQKEKHSKAHTQRVEQMQRQQQEELSRLSQNYELQKRLAIDFLTARADSLNAEYDKKRRLYETQDEEKELSELEKRIRQSRSAREKRELNEELERLQRERALRLEHEQIQSALKGISSLKTAVSQGVIGIGSLLGDTNLYTGTGLRSIQGITSEQLSLALAAVNESNKKKSGAGNHYTIDLTGAVIRSEDDIKRIIDGFEEANRSIGRDIWRS